MNVSNLAQRTKVDRRLNAYLFVCLSLILVGLSLLLIDVHDQAHHDYSPNDSVQWLESFGTNEEPDQTLNLENRRPIGNAVWDFQYSSIVQILWRAKINDRNELVIDSETLRLLQGVYSVLPQAMNSAELRRLDFVIKKSIPSRAGAELANLLNRYYFYEQENMAALQRVNSLDDELKRQQLRLAGQSAQERQIRFFGKNIAITLFSEYNKTQNYLNARRLINLSESLTASQKRERLEQLQNVYRQTLKD